MPSRAGARALGPEGVEEERDEVEREEALLCLGAKAKTRAGNTSRVETNAPMIAMATKKPKLATVCQADIMRVRNPRERATEVVTMARPVC